MRLCSITHSAMLVAAEVTSWQTQDEWNKGKKSHKKPLTHHSFTAHLTWSAVSLVIAHVRQARRLPLAQSMEDHGTATRYDTSTSRLWFSKRESGGWSGAPWHHLMNTAAGGTKCIHCNFNSPRSFSPKSDGMVHILQFKNGGWSCLSEKEVPHSSLITRIKQIFWVTMNLSGELRCLDHKDLRDDENVWGEIKGVCFPHQGEFFFKSLVGGEHGWSESFLRAVQCAPPYPLSSPAHCFFTQRSSANEKRWLHGVSAFWHPFMLNRSTPGRHEDITRSD